MKTTNAKARGLQTPAPPAGTVKPEKTGKRASTQRVKKFAPLVEQSQAEVQDKPVEEDVPDIEYMPPKPKGMFPRSREHARRPWYLTIYRAPGYS